MLAVRCTQADLDDLFVQALVQAWPLGLLGIHDVLAQLILAQHVLTAHGIVQSCHWAGSGQYAALHAVFMVSMATKQGRPYACVASKS